MTNVQFSEEENLSPQHMSGSSRAMNMSGGQNNVQKKSILVPLIIIIVCVIASVIILTYFYSGVSRPQVSDQAIQKFTQLENTQSH